MPYKLKATNEQILQAYKDTGSVWKAAEILGMCGQSVHERLQKLGKIKEPNWTTEEDWMLKQLYSQFPETCFLNNISVELKRSNASVACRANELGLTNPHRPHSLEHVRKSMSSPNRYNNSKTIRGVSSRGGYRDDIGIYVRSAWEANYARYLNWLKDQHEIKNWTYEPDTFEFPVRRGTRLYTPDFKVEEDDGKIEYHEVKGYLTQEAKTALKRMGKYYPGTKLVLIDGPVYKELAKKLKKLIQGWEQR